MRVLGFALLIFSLALPAAAEWRRAVSPNFVVYGDVSPEQLTGFTQKVEQFDSFLRRRAGVGGNRAASKLVIFMVGRGANMSDLIGSPGNSIVNGFYTYGPNGPMAVVKRVSGAGQNSLDADAVLFHEYVHHFMFSYFPAAYPQWFVEGFAEFFSTTDFDDKGRAQFGKPPFYRAGDLFIGPDWPVKELLKGTTVDLSDSKRSSFYGRAWLLTHYLMLSPGRQNQLDRYIRAINDGVDSLEAARLAFGDLEELENDLNAYLRKNKLSYRTESDPTPLTSAITVSLIPEDEAITIVERLKIMRRLNNTEWPDLISRLLGARALFPDSAAAPGLLSQVYFEAGDFASAQAAADDALAKESENAPALLYKGKSEVKLLAVAGVKDDLSWRKARAPIVAANRADTENPYPLFAYYTSFLDQGITAPPVARDALSKAFSLAPLDPGIRGAMVSALIAEGDLKFAAKILRPVAFNPHGGEAANQARLLLAQIEQSLAEGRKKLVPPPAGGHEHQSGDASDE